MNHIRERGIYQTPDGIRLVASSRRKAVLFDHQHITAASEGSSYLLFNTYAWAYHGPADYIINESGEIESDDKSRLLRADDLIDTGYTAGAH